MAQILRNMQTMHIYNLFQASQKLCRGSTKKNHSLLARHGNLVLKIMLVPDTSFTTWGNQLQVCKSPTWIILARPNSFAFH